MANLPFRTVLVRRRIHLAWCNYVLFCHSSQGYIKLYFVTNDNENHYQ